MIMRGVRRPEAGTAPEPNRFLDVDEPGLVELAKIDPEAFGELYERNVDRIYSYVYYRIGNVEEAEDLTARTFYQALNNIQRYVEKGVPFAAWLYRIAHNLVANHHRSRSRWRVSSLEELEVSARPGDRPDRAAELHERQGALWSAIHRQPEERQRLLIMKFADRMSNQEIGRLMGRTESAIKSLYFRTLKSLKADLEAREWQ
jgi:RNA polymerase sigma-70 factor (ECF subfamily)